MVKWILIDKTGELPAGSSVALPIAGTFSIGGKVQGSVENVQTELEQFYPGRFSLEKQD